MRLARGSLGTSPSFLPLMISVTPVTWVTHRLGMMEGLGTATRQLLDVFVPGHDHVQIALLCARESAPPYSQTWRNRRNRRNRAMSFSPLIDLTVRLLPEGTPHSRLGVTYVTAVTPGSGDNVRPGRFSYRHTSILIEKRGRQALPLVGTQRGLSGFLGWPTGVRSRVGSS